MLDVDVVDDRLEHAGEIVHDNDRLRAGVTELVLEFPGGVERIGVDDDETGAQGSENRDRILQNIGHHDRDAVALLQAHGLQSGGERRAVTIDLAEGQFGAEIHVGDFVPEFVAAGIDHVDDRVEFVHVDLDRHPFRILFKPGLVAHRVSLAFVVFRYR